MSIYQNNTHELVLAYIEAGLAPTPVKPRSKQPLLDGWTNLKIAAEDVGKHFNQPSNIGILLGTPSGGLVDIDIDSAIALKLAPHFLPPTTMKFGRESKPSSHWLYLVPDPGRHEAFTGADGTIIELRGNSHLTVFPGSTHPSGEAIRFVDGADSAASQSTWAELSRAAVKVAVAAEIAGHWKPGYRHDLALALPAFLARRGWSRTEVITLIGAVADVMGDDERDDRIKGVNDTCDRFENKAPVTGDEELAGILSQEAYRRIHRWCSPSALPVVVAGPNNGLVPQIADLTTDAAAADAFADAWHGNLIHSNDVWYRRNHEIFEPVPDLVVQGIVKELMQAGVDSLGSAGFAQTALRGCLNRNRINAAVELSRAQFQIDDKVMDANKDLAGCSDGRVLKLGAAPSGGEPIVTKKLGTFVDPEARCPLWTDFLDHVLDGNKPLIDFVRRAVGYSLTGSCAEQCMFILIGTGANGKSTFLNTLQALFGDYAAPIPIQTLMVQRFGSQQTNDLAGLLGKRFVTASEGEKDEVLAEAKIKLMTGGDLIRCRLLYGEYFHYQPQFKLWLATNNLPEVKGTDDAIWRRIYVVHFPITIPSAQRDGRLPERLIAELPGILTWALQGLAEWRDQGLNPPEAVLKSTGLYRESSDTVGQWIALACTLGPGQRATGKELYGSYCSWCENSAVVPLTNPSFGKELSRRGFKTHRNGKGMSRLGIALRPEDSGPSLDTVF